MERRPAFRLTPQPPRAYADVVATSVSDIVYDAGYHEAQDGGALSVTCDPQIMTAELCGGAQVE